MLTAEPSRPRGPIRSKAKGLWLLLEDSSNIYLALVLAVVLLAALVVSSKGPGAPPLLQFKLGIQEIVDTRHIGSTFLPIAYVAILGWAEVLGPHVGITANHAALVTQIIFLLLIVVLVYAVLTQLGVSLRIAAGAALMIGLYPQYLNGVTTLKDTNLALLSLLALLFTLIRLRRNSTWINAALVGMALAFAVMVRPNLLTMVPLLIWPVYGLKRSTAARLLFVAVAAGALMYASATGFVHGRPFFPDNGPYNLYAGFNPYTESILLRDHNAENSIVLAMAAKGVHARLDWSQPPDLPGIDDARDKKYIPFYKTETERFIVNRPGSALKLCFVKLVTLMGQSYVDVPGAGAALHRLTRLVKHATAFVAPAWLAVLLYSIFQRKGVASTVIVSMTALYMVPFLVTNADPRFRITIEGVLIMDIVRMLYALYARHKHTPAR